jgi:threonine dehydrogenase-like Zn-dependent dehydrogenase
VRRGRRIVFVKPQYPLECWEGEVADPVPGGVLIRTTIAGVCGTDAHRLAGDVPLMGHPVNFGHEGVGTIEVLGAGVATDWAGVPVHVGDVVYWTPTKEDPGRRSEQQPWPPPATVPNPASYQDFATLSPSNVFYRIPEETQAEAVIAFGCAMPTALGGLARLGGIRPGQSVVVQGCGPVGLASTFLASLSPARQVIVIGAPDNRLSAAQTLGATTTISLEQTTPEERADRVRSMTEGRGADVIIEAAGHKSAFDEGLDLLAENGRYVIVGLFSGHGKVELDPFKLNNESQSIIGSLGHTHYSDHLTVIQLAQRFGGRLGFRDLITHRFPLPETEAAIAAMRSGEAIKAIVVPPASETVRKRYPVRRLNSPHRGPVIA